MIDTTAAAARFAERLPARPYCADDLQDGLLIRCRRYALRQRYIQINGPATYQALAFDLDWRGAAHLAHRDGIVPPPNVTIENPKNGHAHAIYLLKTPVARHDAARIAPLRLLAACERGLSRRLGGDRAYSGLIVKNPLHPDWRAQWMCTEPYDLGHLESWLWRQDLAPDPSPRSTWGAGRNVTVFDELRAIAYRKVRQFKSAGATVDEWRERCLKLAIALNRQFPRPLGLPEVRAIAKSVAKWTWRNFSLEQFSARQSVLGKRGNAKRWAGHVSAETSKPWIAEGVSRRTYYYRRRKTAGEMNAD